LEHDLFRKPVATFRDHALEERQITVLPMLPRCTWVTTIG
jgi:hypothetical protein